MGIPALRGAGAARLGTWETIVFQWFFNVSWSAPGDPLGSRRRPQEAAAGVAVDRNRKYVCSIVVFKAFLLIIEKCGR